MLFPSPLSVSSKDLLHAHESVLQVAHPLCFPWLVELLPKRLPLRDGPLCQRWCVAIPQFARRGNVEESLKPEDSAGTLPVGAQGPPFQARKPQPPTNPSLCGKALTVQVPEAPPQPPQRAVDRSRVRSLPAQCAAPSTLLADPCGRRTLVSSQFQVTSILNRKLDFHC